jgi:hypothetical protein
VFNEDFRQFVIRIGDKARDGETISGVMIEDHTNAGKTKMNQILADSGQMYTTRAQAIFRDEPVQGYPVSGAFRTAERTAESEIPFCQNPFWLLDESVGHEGVRTGQVG